MEKPSTLPGRGGFDFNLDLIYDSSESDIRRPFFQWPNTFDRLRWYGLGVGWRFDLPHIHQNVLYLPNIGSFEFGHVEFMGMRFTNRSLQDMRLEGFGNFTSGNLRSTMRLRFHNGTVYYFYNHLILCMADRYGNTIRFEYEAAPLQPAGRRLTRIIDTNGRVITFERAGADRRDMVIVGCKLWRVEITLIINALYSYSIDSVSCSAYNVK